MYELSWWTQRDPAEVFGLERDDILLLAERYGGAKLPIFMDVLGHATEQLSATCVLAEYRYLDPDYRNEHGVHYSKTFRRYPSVAHRLHFFAKHVGKIDTRKPTGFSKNGYLGYTILRPVPASPVGRTMLHPGPLDPFVTCKATDTVNVFGSELSVAGAPFMSQDSQLGVCVHVTGWVCAYYHHLAHGGARWLPGDIASSAPVEESRLLPAPRMTVPQLTAILQSVGLPPIVYNVADGPLPEGDTIERIACRYLNSGFPVIAAGGGHAFVLVGYRRVIDADGRERVQFIRQDDQEGPYCLVDDVAHDKYKVWKYLVIPLPPKVYVSGEKAEALAAQRFVEALDATGRKDAEDILARIKSGEARFRTRAIRSNAFKTSLVHRKIPPAIAGAYHWIQMSRWIWVVELVDHASWNAGKDCVIAEMLIDATDHAEDFRALSWRLPWEITHWKPDTEDYGYKPIKDPGLLPTVMAGDTRLITL